MQLSGRPATAEAARDDGFERRSGRVPISGQKCGIPGAIKRGLRHRSAIEPVIDPLKAESHLGRCYLNGCGDDAVNTILTAAGYDFRRILASLKPPLRRILIVILCAFRYPISAQSGLLTDHECQESRRIGDPSPHDDDTLIQVCS
jgi:hypothetical protein